jgi:hypothetical protein
LGDEPFPRAIKSLASHWVNPHALQTKCRVFTQAVKILLFGDLRTFFPVRGDISRMVRASQSAGYLKIPPANLSYDCKAQSKAASA